MKKGSEAKGKAVARVAEGSRSTERSTERPPEHSPKRPPERATSASSAGSIDLDSVRELARIATEMNLSEVEVDPSGRIRVRRRVARRVVEGRAAGGARPPISLAPPPPVEGVPEPGTLITSPFVGTFYRAPSPEAPAFAEVGDTVRKGQVVCIVEAMKLMNEIEAEADGKVAEILARNGEHVEYGQPLIRLVKG
jgi:acetyl-CoA carboxylase biotin carboxyl carrier protein